MTYAVVGIGACGPEADAYLDKAKRRLMHHPVWQWVCTSSTYRNPAWGMSVPHDFRNSAMLLQTQSSPAALLRCLLAIERELGRVRAVRYGRRNIDLDLLWMQTEPMDSSFLTLPHPRLEQRAFALVPLIEVLDRAQIRVPYTYRQAAARLRGQERLFRHPSSVPTRPMGAAEPT